MLNANRFLVFDARAGVPVDVKPPAPRAERLLTLLGWMLPTASGPITSGNTFGTFVKPSPAYYSPVIAPYAPELRSLLTAEWLDSSTNTFYAGGWAARSALPAGRKIMNLRRAAVVHARYAAPLHAAPLVNEIDVGGGTPENPVGLTGGLVVALPHERTEYYYSDDDAVRWGKELWMHDEEYSRSIILRELAAPYRTGHHYTSHWNTPPFSPALPEASTLPHRRAYREEDTLTFFLPMFGDREGHDGFTAGDTRLALYRTGELIGEADTVDGALFQVPAERATACKRKDTGQFRQRRRFSGQARIARRGMRDRLT